MKNLDLNELGVQEMNAQEKRENNGGFFGIGDIYEIVLDRSLNQDIRALAGAAVGAYAQIIKEGGTTSTQMPFP
jgi:hypothetical protein